MDINIAGRTFSLRENGDGYYVGADEIESIDYHGSPTVIDFEPPIGPAGQVSLAPAGDVALAIIGKLSGG
jgi:hypothetical protein